MRQKEKLNVFGCRMLTFNAEFFYLWLLTLSKFVLLFSVDIACLFAMEYRGHQSEEVLL